MSKKKRVPSPVAKFKVGDKVRVKPGIKDVDYPDMPLGGWAGTVIEIDGADTFLVRWIKETLDAIHPVFKKRCEIDGLDPDEYTLTGDDLDADIGGPLAIEDPTEITTRLLSSRDQDDRIRMVFGLTSNDPLPEVDGETLKIYRQHLAANLTFPIEVEYGAEYGHPEKAKVTGLGSHDEAPSYIDNTYGVLCDVRMGDQNGVVPVGELEVTKGKTNRQLIEDYCYWFWNNR